MLDFITFVSLCFAAVSICDALHHPKVYEDVIEYTKNENSRIARNSDAPYKMIHHPPVFKYDAAKQQDHLKFRYAQQQKVNTFTMVNGMAKSYKYLKRPHNGFAKPVEDSEKFVDDWQPFDPKTPKKFIDNVQTPHHPKAINDKLYKPHLAKANVPSQNNQLPEKNMLNVINTDLLAEGSENVETVEPERRNSAGEYNKIVYFQPNQLQTGQSGLNTGEAVDPNAQIPKSETQLTALNDLIGKNPNVQLEGLKRLLQNNPTSKEYSQTAAQLPEQIQSHMTLSDIQNNHFQQNIQLSHDGNKITLPTSQTFDKNSLEDFQKQLDEASKLQAEQVIAKAQQEAQAQVEAQHKAIALAQVQAQQAALESIQKSLYGGAQALPLIQQSQEEQYHAAVNTLPPLQHPAPPAKNIVPIPSTHDMSITSHSSIIHDTGKAVPQLSANSLQGDITLKKIVPQAFTSTRLVNVPPPKTPVALYKNVAPQSYGSKEVLYYAPNHHHQAAAQRQAEKTLLAQVEAQNNAILHSHKSSPTPIRQMLKAEQVESEETKAASSIQSVAESEPQATAYQQILLESKETEDAAVEEKDYDDFDDYAAKYAFGYRIKDAKEGNDFGHEERRNGKSLEGSYHVLLPDGRLQKVEYYADNSGYHAKVTYEHSS